MTYRNNLHKNLIFLREAANLKQNDMQQKLGIKRNTWSNWENEISEPSIEKILIIASFFDIDVGKLITSDLANAHDEEMEEERPLLASEEELQHYNKYPSDIKYKNQIIDLQQQTISALQGEVNALKMAMHIKKAQEEKPEGKDQSA